MPAEDIYKFKLKIEIYDFFNNFYTFFKAFLMLFKNNSLDINPYLKLQFLYGVGLFCDFI